MVSPTKLTRGAPVQRGVVSALQTATGTLGSSIGVAAGGLVMEFYCPGRRRRLSAISVFLCKSVLYGPFVWARRALKHQKRRFPARAAWRYIFSAPNLPRDLDAQEPFLGPKKYLLL